MANNSFKVKSSLNVQPNAGTVVTTQGDLAVNSATNQVEIFTTAVESVTTNSNTQTLTNKSISGATNTLSAIPNSATTATNANTTSAIVARDASGNFSANTITAALVGNATTASSASALTGSIAESQVTNLVADLAAKAPINSPTFIGTVTAPNFSGTLSGNATSITGAISESQVTNLVSDLALKSTISSPTFTGTVVIPAIQITASPVAGAVLTSDKLGNGTWSAASAPIFVAAKYSNSNATYITSGTPTIVDYSYKVFDTHNAVTTGSSWNFTAPISGKYDIKASAMFDSLPRNIGTEMLMYFYVNGTNVSTVHYDQAEVAITNRYVLYGTDIIPLNAGDSFSVVIYQSTGITSALRPDTVYQSVTINRVGN